MRRNYIVGRQLEFFLWMFAILMTALGVLAIFDSSMEPLAPLGYLSVAAIFALPAALLTRKSRAIKVFKAGATCYDAEVIEVDRNSFTGRAEVKCAYIDMNGKRHIVSDHKKLHLRLVEKEWKDGGFKKIDPKDRLLAKVYVCQHDSEKYEVELFWMTR